MEKIHLIMITILSFSAVVITLIIPHMDDKLRESYLLYSILVVEVIGMWAMRYFQIQDKRADKKTKHTKDIRKTLLLITEINFTASRSIKNEFSFPKEYLSIEERTSKARKYLHAGMSNDNQLYESELKNFDQYDFYDFAMSHLQHKKYHDIFQHLKKAREILQGLNQKPPFNSYLRQEIEAKISEKLPKLSAFNYGLESNYYDLDKIYNSILTSMTSEISQNTDDLEMVNGDKKNTFWIRTEKDERHHIVLAEDKTEYFEKYKELFNEIIHDNKFVTCRDNQENMINNIRSELELFSEKLHKLTTKLHAEKMIEGKCDGCP